MNTPHPYSASPSEAEIAGDIVIQPHADSRFHTFAPGPGCMETTHDTAISQSTTIAGGLPLCTQVSLCIPGALLDTQTCLSRVCCRSAIYQILLPSCHGSTRSAWTMCGDLKAGYWACSVDSNAVARYCDTLGHGRPHQHHHSAIVAPQGEQQATGLASMHCYDQPVGAKPRVSHRLVIPPAAASVTHHRQIAFCTVAME